MQTLEVDKSQISQTLGSISQTTHKAIIEVLANQLLSVEATLERRNRTLSIVNKHHKQELINKSTAEESSQTDTLT